MWNETNMALTLTQEIQVPHFMRKTHKVVYFCICLSNHIQNKWGVLNPSEKGKEKERDYTKLEWRKRVEVVDENMNERERRV